jgi:hypothetical protein
MQPRAVNACVKRSSQLSFIEYCLSYIELYKVGGMQNASFKLSCDSRFQRAFTACSCVLKEITLVGSNQGSYFVNETACSKRTLKTRVVTQL